MNVTYMNTTVQQISRASHLIKQETLYQVPIISPLTPSLAITILFSVSVHLTTMGTSHKWNHAVFLFCDWLISLSITSSRFSML